MRTLLVVLLIIAGPTSAESPDSLGTLDGRVLGPNSKRVSFARVELPDIQRTVQSDEEGRFKLTGLPPGRHAIRVIAPALFAPPETLDVVPGRNAYATIMMGRVRLLEPGVVVIPGPRQVLSRDDLVAEVEPVRSVIKVFETPSFRVRIRNVSSRPVLLVYCNEESATGMSPKARLEIEAPFGAFAGGWGPGPERIRTDRYDVWPKDFIELQPGECFAPYGSEEVTPNFEGNSPTRPGHYGVRFRYSTAASDVSGWTTWYPDPDLLALFARVPVVELEAKADFKVDF